MGTPRAIDVLNTDGITLLILLFLVWAAFIGVRSPKKWRLVLQGVMRPRLGKQMMRDEIDLRDRSFIALLVLALGIIALFIWQFGVSTSVLDHGAMSYVVVFAALCGVLVMQVVVLISTSKFFQGDAGSGEYLYSTMLLIIGNGLLLLPLVVVITYLPGTRHLLMPLGLALTGLFLVVRWLRGVWVGRSEGIAIRYILIYLCAAEIVPALLALHAAQLPTP